MSLRYEEILAGESVLRAPPGARHEVICERLHQLLAAATAGQAAAKLLPARYVVELAPGTLLRPDAAIVTAATGKLWLAVEVIEAGDQRVDTVTKKELYENARLPRLWMVDVRYDNVEVYSGGPHGLALHRILAAGDQLTEKLLPDLSVAVSDLFTT
jgi:Putative restriction endonuclease